MMLNFLLDCGLGVAEVVDGIGEASTGVRPVEDAARATAAAIEAMRGFPKRPHVTDRVPLKKLRCTECGIAVEPWFTMCDECFREEVAKLGRGEPSKVGRAIGNSSNRSRQSLAPFATWRA